MPHTRRPDRPVGAVVFDGPLPPLGEGRRRVYAHPLDTIFDSVSTPPTTTFMALMQRDDRPRSARAFAPGSIGNIGPGLDVLGCAVTGPGDAVIATRVDAPGVRIDDPGHPELSRDPALHAS